MGKSKQTEAGQVMTSRLFLGIVLLSIIFGLSGCRVGMDVSSDPADTDFAPFHPEVVRGDRFTIQPDVRVFTLYAYLNGVAGWEVENGDGFTPERSELRDAIRDRLARVDAKAVRRWRAFYDHHRQIAYRYLYYTMALGIPPDFNYIIPIEQAKYPEIIRSLSGLNTVLSEFYVQVGLQEMFDRHYRAQMTGEVQKYDPQRIETQIGQIYEYLRLDPAQTPAFDVVIIPAPYDSHYDANALAFQNRLFIVEGPGSNDYGLNIHEYLHMLMDDLIPADLAGQRSKYQEIWKANRDARYVKGGYGEVHTYVEECLVRALDHRMRSRLEPEHQARELATLKDETANGLVLEEDFFQALESYEANPRSDVRSFIADLLRNVAKNY